MKSLLRSLKTCLAVATLAMLPLSAALAGPTIAITGPTSVKAGSTFTMAVSALDVTDLFAFQFDVVYDPALFAASGATEGAFLASGGTTFFDGGSIDNATGVISFVFGSLIGAVPGVNGSGVLASFEFDAEEFFVGLSTGAFQLTNVLALDSAFNVIDVAIQGQSVSIPESATLGLSLAALALVGASVRRRRVLGTGVSSAQS